MENVESVTNIRIVSIQKRIFAGYSFVISGDPVLQEYK
ncbi:hypothetical protein LEP1GSC060_1168 [Leptospira weilii serovar Ranarum str. ICFT]|uniref:Uncharacterized protein n=1 Tax=Leptospira weilii serovar Ranarum str. ICFT TaxID=1218598 RepID=N1WJT3_9LEPT|nr:hypothetical protein LEP1GSC060_1168 [Leptospira weilii serovar Ranarum str. ICFT]